MDGAETLTATPSGRPSPSMPVREDCWSEEASFTLIEAWGERYIELNRGNLRQKHWQEVADAVNDRHGAVKKSRRTDVQCKNRIDTLKKKYKLEKARFLASGGNYSSKWPFFDQLDGLIGNSMQSKVKPKVNASPSPSPPLALSLPYRKSTHPLPHALVVPVAARSVREKRSPPSPCPVPALAPAPVAVDDSFFRRNYSAVAAAAAADAADSGSTRSSSEICRRREGGGGGGEVDGFRELAQAISRFAEIYERVEGSKQRQMIELEKERMEFMKSLEFQRMQLFMDSQVQLEKIKRAKRAAASDVYD